MKKYWPTAGGVNENVAPASFDRLGDMKPVVIGVQPPSAVA